MAVPVYQTIAHDFEDAAHAGAVFDLDIPGFHYNRLNNPTNSVLEGRLQAIEGGAGAVVLSSGAAAVNYSITNLAWAGDNIVTTPQLYGSTYTLFAYVFPGQGVELRSPKMTGRRRSNRSSMRAPKRSSASRSAIPPSM